MTGLIYPLDMRRGGGHSDKKLKMLLWVLLHVGHCCFAAHSGHSRWSNQCLWKELHSYSILSWMFCKTTTTTTKTAYWIVVAHVYVNVCVCACLRTCVCVRARFCCKFVPRPEKEVVQSSQLLENRSPFVKVIDKLSNAWLGLTDSTSFEIVYLCQFQDRLPSFIFWSRFHYWKGWRRDEVPNRDVFIKFVASFVLMECAPWKKKTKQKKKKERKK